MDNWRWLGGVSFYLTILCLGIYLLAIAASVVFAIRRRGIRLPGRATIGPEAAPESGSIRFRGTGTTTTPPHDFAAGAYRLDYQFPKDVLTSVRMVDIRTAEEAVLFIKAGEGTAQFELTALTALAFVVEPADEAAAWRLRLRPLHVRSDDTDAALP